MVGTPTLALVLSPLEVVFLVDQINNADIALGLEERDRYVPLARRQKTAAQTAVFKVKAASQALALRTSTP